MEVEHDRCAVDGCEKAGPFGDLWVWVDAPVCTPARWCVCGDHHKMTADCETTVYIDGVLFVRWSGGRSPGPYPLRIE